MRREGVRGMVAKLETLGAEMSKECVQMWRGVEMWRVVRRKSRVMKLGIRMLVIKER